MPTAEQRRLAVLGKLVLEMFPKLLQIILMNIVPSTEYMCRFFRKNPQLRHVLHEDDFSVVERMDTNSGYSEFSLRLSYTFFRVFPWLEPPAQNWGNSPSSDDITLADDIERIRRQANDIISMSDTDVDENVYRTSINQFQQITERIRIHFNLDANIVPDLGLLQMVDDAHVMNLIRRLHSQHTIADNPFLWKSVTEGRTRYSRLGLIIVEILPSIVREVIVSNISASMLYRQIEREKKNDPKKFNKCFTREEENKLNTLKDNSYDNLDFTLLCKLIRAYAVLDKPTEGWGNRPKNCNLTISDDIERLRFIRNSFAHRINTTVTEEQMNIVFSEVEDVSDRVDRYLRKTINNGFKSAVCKYRTCQIDSDLETRYVQALRELEEIKERFAVRHIYFYYGKSFEGFIDKLRNEMTNHEKTKITIVIEGTVLSEEQIKYLNDKKDQINEGQILVQFEKATVGSLVLHVSVDDTVIMSNSKLAEALSSFIQRILQFGSINDTARINVVLVSEVDCTELGLDLDSVELESCFDDLISPGALQLELIVKPELFDSEQLLSSELDGLVERVINSNGLEELPIVTAKLTSRFHDSIVKDLSDVTVFEGSDAHFEIWTKQQGLCSMWSKDQSELVNSDKLMCKMFRSIHLDIKNISFSDQGCYTVKVNGIERKACLHVTEYFTKNPQSTECMEGGNVQFICEVVEDGFPACWSKNGTNLKNDKKYKMLQVGKVHSLSILQCDLHDAGDYTVNINNRVRTASLNVNEFPAALRSLSEEDKGLYFEIIKSGKETRYYIRIVIIGENGVGKTCLLRRLLGDTIEDVESTDGIDIVHRCKIRLHDGKWVIDKGTDKRRDLIIRLKRALNARTAEYINMGKKEQNQEGFPQHSYTTTADTSQIGRNTIPEVAQNKPDTSKANIENQVCRQTTEDTAENLESSTSKTDVEEQNSNVLDLEVIESSQSSPFSQSIQLQTTEETPASRPVKVFTEDILKQISDFINDIEKYDIPKEVLVDCGFWDFAGQKHYYPTHPVFLNSNALHLLVADVMKDIKQISVEGGYDKIGEYIDFWFDSIHSCGASDSTMDSTGEYLNPPVILVCTHIDKCQTELDERKNKFRQQLMSLLHNEAKQKHLRRICYVSNTEPTEEDFDHLRRSIFEFGKEIHSFGITIPLRWIRLERSLGILQDAGVNMLSWFDITDLSLKCSINDENEINLFLKYQHNVGNVIYYECLKEFIILNQKWLADAFKCLVSDKYDVNLQLTQEWKMLEDTGELKHSLITKLFQKDPHNKFYLHEDQLLKVMEMFGILIKPTTLMENGQKLNLQNYFMPCMISEKRSIMQLYDLFGVKRDCCVLTPWLCIEFDFMPFDFFNHICSHYARQYSICIEAVSRRIALYHGMGVFLYDSTKSRKFVLCFSKNTIAIQMWQWKKLEAGAFKAMLEELKSVVNNVKYKYEPRQVTFTVKIKCAHGSLHMVAGRQSYKELTDLGDNKYFCEEHNEVHDTKDIFQTWFEDYSKDEENEPSSKQFKAESGIDTLKTAGPPIRSIIYGEEMTYARMSNEESRKINQGSQTQRFNQRCHVCDKDPPVCWCHDCQKSTCNDCHNYHSDSDDNSSHILQHVDDMYALDSKFKVDVNLVTDLKVFNNGLLVIADWNGKRLVTCHITRPEQYTIALPGDPYRVAVVDEHTAAVTLPIISTIVIVNVKERKVLKHIRANVAAGGIMFKDGQLLFGIEKAIKIIDISGEVKHTIPVGNVSNYICGGEAGIIFYTDLDKLYCIDSKGNPLFTFTDPSMRMPRVITKDNEGHLLVLCEKSNNIVRVSPNGKQGSVVITQIPMHSWSPHMCYDAVSHSVIICRDKTVFLYKKL